MTVGIVTDSSSSLAAADAEREQIQVVPLQVVIGADTYDEGSPELTSDMIAEALAAFGPGVCRAGAEPGPCRPR